MDFPKWLADIIPVFPLARNKEAGVTGNGANTVTPAGVSGTSPLYSSHSYCPHFLAAEVEAVADPVSATMWVLVKTIQSDGCGWASGTLGGNSAQSPHCRLVELLLLGNPASAAWPRPPGLLKH